MIDVQAQPETTRTPGLASRLLGVIFSPRDTYAAIAARPRIFGALIVTVVLSSAIQFAFLSTAVGQDAMIDQQLAGMERFGMDVTPEMVQQMESRAALNRYFAAGSQLVATPIFMAVIAGLLLGVFNALLDGNATFRQVYALLAHSGIIIVLQQLFSTPINYFSGEIRSAASLGVFAPMLDPDGFAGGFLGAVDLFLVWWVISGAIGLGVLYKRRTGPIATSLLCVYAFIALLIALF